MDTGIQAPLEGGTQGGAPGPDNGGGGLHNDGASFWQSHGDFFRQIESRYGIQAPQGEAPQSQPQQSGQPDDYQEYLRWKQAREAKDPRALLEIAGMQPGDVLNATLFGGPQQEQPKPDPVEAIRGELNAIRKDIESERRERQSVQERISEANAKSQFLEQVKSMQDLTLVQKWGQEAMDTAWNDYIMSVEAAVKAKAAGQPFEPPSLRASAIRVENYLRQQASRLGEVIGGTGAAQLEPLPFNAPPAAPNQAASVPPASQEREGRIMSPTLTNVGGEAGATPQGAATKQQLRERALARAKQLRG
jgi:hypothetical protein